VTTVRTKSRQWKSCRFIKLSILGKDPERRRALLIALARMRTLDDFIYNSVRDRRSVIRQRRRLYGCLMVFCLNSSPRISIFNRTIFIDSKKFVCQSLIITKRARFRSFLKESRLCARHSEQNVGAGTFIFS
jgi:hypothetical protein